MPTEPSAARAFRAPLRTSLLLTMAVALVLALVPMAMLGAPEASAAGKSRASGTLKIGLSASLSSLDPMPYGASTFFLPGLMYNSAIVMEGVTPGPALVKSWSMAPGGTALTLHLRPGVTYSDGTPFNAAALVWNIDWQKEPATDSEALALWSEVTAVATNDETVKLTFPSPLPEIYAMLAAAPIVKPNAPDSGVGTGPFMVSSFVPGTSLTVVRNPHYWQHGAPHLSSIVLTNYAESATAALALQAGTIDMLLLPPTSALASLKSAGDKTLLASPTDDGYLPTALFSLVVNTSAPPLNNVLVRQALSLAFDRADFVTTALHGQGEATESIFAPGVKAYQASPSTGSYNLKKAKALLKKAGVSNLHLSVDAVSILPQTTFMPVYQQDLAKIGVTLSINEIDAATWVTIMGPGNFPQLITQENGFTDGDPAINFGARDLRPTENSEHFTSAKYTSMINAAAAQTDPTKRLADYKAIGALLQQQSIIIPLAASGSAVAAAYSPNVTGVHGSIAGTPIYGEISLK